MHDVDLPERPAPIQEEQMRETGGGQEVTKEAEKVAEKDSMKQAEQ